MGAEFFDIGFDVNKFDENVKKAQRSVVGFSKGATSAIDVTNENLKIQKEYILELEGKYKELQKVIENTAPGRAKQGLMQQAAGIGADIEAEKKALTELQAVVKSTADEEDRLATKLNNAKNEMAELAAAGQQDSARYQQLQDDAVGYQTAINGVNNELNALKGNPGLSAFVQGLGLASGALSTVQGVTALFVSDNENLNKIMVQLQATMAAAIGVQQLQNSLQKESGVIQSVMAVQSLARAKAEGLATKNTIAAGIAQKAFNIIAKANPYVLLATALVTVVGALVMFSSKTKKAVADNEALTKSTVDGAEESIMGYKSLQSQWNSLGNDMKAKKKFVEQNKDEFNKLGVEVDNVTAAEKFLVQNSANVVDALMLRARAAAKMAIATEKYKEYYNNIDKANKKENEYQGDTFGAINKAVDKFGNRYLGIGNKVLEDLNQTKTDADDIMTSMADDMTKSAQKLSKTAKLYTGEEKKPAKTKTKKEKADEFLPPGSVAEIQKRLAEIDKALSKATGEKQISELRNKRIAAALELAAAEKKIQIQSIKDQLDESNKLWEQYYSAVESLGKDKADKIYSGLIDHSKSQFEQMQQMQQSLLSKENLSDEDKEVLKTLNTAIDQMLGKQTALDKFKNTIDSTLSTMTTDAQRLQYINSQKEGASKDDGSFAYLAELDRKYLDDQKKTYQEFLKSTESFEQQKTEITAKYAEIRNGIQNDESLSPEDKKTAENAANANESKDLAKAFVDSLTNDPAWTTNFETLGSFAFSKFSEIRKKLESQLAEAKSLGADDNSPEVQKIIDQINKLDEVANRNPFAKLTNDFRKFLDSLKDGNNSIDAIAGKVAAGAGLANNAISTGLGIAQDLGIQFDEQTQGIINDVQTTIGGIGDIATGIVKMDPVSIIKGIGGVIKGLSGLLNGDRKKEKNIKQWAAAVEELKTKYEELQRAVDKALGEDSYKTQNAMIANLRQQQATLQKMINEEGGKKKKDDGKIAEWQNQINSINGQIEDIFTNMANQISQTNVKDLSNQLADALIEAYSKGEDAAEAYGKVADDVMRNAVKNALRMQLLEKPMENIIKQLISNMGFKDDGTGTFDGLTEDERNQIKSMMQQASQNYMSALDAYSDLFGAAATDASSLEGAIKGVSEETASLIAGQMNAIRIMQGQSLEINTQALGVIRNQLLQLTQIEYNTRFLRLIYFEVSKNKDDGKLRAAGIV